MFVQKDFTNLKMVWLLIMPQRMHWPQSQAARCALQGSICPYLLQPYVLTASQVNIKMVQTWLMWTTIIFIQHLRAKSVQLVGPPKIKPRWNCPVRWRIQISILKVLVFDVYVASIQMANQVLRSVMFVLLVLLENSWLRLILQDSLALNGTLYTFLYIYFLKQLKQRTLTYFSGSSLATVLLESFSKSRWRFQRKALAALIN